MNRTEAARNAARVRTERGTVQAICPVCGKIFKLWKSHLGKVRCCSRACRSVAMQLDGNWRWRGGAYLTPDGYRFVRTETGEYIAEHRLVMEQALGRPLLSTEVIHHINENRLDNRTENLVLYETAGAHALENHVMRDPITGRFIRRLTDTSSS